MQLKESIIGPGKFRTLLNYVVYDVLQRGLKFYIYLLF